MVEDVEGSFEDAWISVDALLLLGVLHCGGFDSEKAAVFHRVVAPEYASIVSITDKDLETAIRFMVIVATILEEMTNDMIEEPSPVIDYQFYKRKIKRYEPTFTAMMDDFENTIFGLFYNRRNKDQFIEMLATDGWKYFSVQNLNELFSIIVKDHPPLDEVEEPPAAKPEEKPKEEIKVYAKKATQPKTEEKKAAKPKVLEIIEYQEPK